MPSMIAPMAYVRGSRHTESASAIRSRRVAFVAGSSWTISREGTARSENSPAARTSTPIAHRCQPTPTCHAAMATPIPAPTTVPMLKKAWKRGMRVRSKACSTAAASTFIITSVALMPMPMSPSPTAVIAYDSIVCTPTPTTATPSEKVMMVAIIPRRAPQRTTMTLARERPTMDAAPATKSRMPTCRSLMPRSFLTAGRRDAHEAKPRPVTKKIVKIAVRQATSCLRVSAVSIRTSYRIDSVVLESIRPR